MVSERVRESEAAGRTCILWCVAHSFGSVSSMKAWYNSVLKIQQVYSRFVAVENSGDTELRVDRNRISKPHHFLTKAKSPDNRITNFGVRRKVECEQVA